MIRAFSTLIILLCGFPLFGQMEILDTPTDLKRLKVFENSIGSINKGLQHFNPYFDEDFEDIYEVWPNVIKKPLIFRRTNDAFIPHLHSWYFFDQDSIVKLVHYRWGYANTTVEASDEEIRDQVNRKTEYLEKYRMEKENLYQQFGPPTKEDLTIETNSYLTYKTVWESQAYRLILKATIDKIPVEFKDKNMGVQVIPRSEIEIKLLMKEK